MAENEALTTEDLAKGGAVAQAGMEAAAQESEKPKRRAAATKAIRREAAKVDLELSEEHAKMIATAIVDEMDSRGAFDPPPEPVAAPHTPAEQMQQPPAEQREADRPRSTSFAERFRSH